MNDIAARHFISKTVNSENYIENFWYCIYLKNTSRFSRAKSCFSKNQTTLSQMFKNFTTFLQTNTPSTYASIQKDVEKVRSSNLPTNLKIVNETLVAIITGSNKNVDLNVFSHFKHKQSRWYTFIVLLLDSRFKVLSTRQKIQFTEALTGTEQGEYLLTAIEDPESAKIHNFIPQNSYPHHLLKRKFKKKIKKEN